MKLIKILYEKSTGKSAPYYYDYDLWTIIKKPIRKWITNCVAYNCPFNTVRIALYKLCGFQIGRNTFIGMHCYLDDMCFEYLKIGIDCVISYGVYFACHGWEQENQPIVVKDGAYIGMRSIIIGKNGDIRGGCDRRESSNWGRNSGKQKYPGRMQGSWGSLQNFRQRRLKPGSTASVCQEEAV